MRKGRFIIAPVCCLIVGLGFLKAYSLKLEHRANRLVRASYEFSGRGKPPSLKEIRNVFGSDLQQLGPCSRDGCGYEVNVSNGLLYSLHLVPYTNLRTQFWEEKGVVQSNSVYFYSLPRVVDVLLKYCSGCDSPNVNPYESHSRSSSGYVEIDMSVSAVARSKALGFDTACLTRLGGCATIAELLPAIWQKAEQDTVNCVIPSHNGKFDFVQPK